jgi:hypothetical protein
MFKPSDIFHLLAVPFYTLLSSFFLVLLLQGLYLSYIKKYHNSEIFLSFSFTGFGCYKLSTSMFGKKTQDENATTENKNMFF